MESKNRTTLFQGLVIDIEQMDVKVGDIRGHVGEDGGITEYQVVLKVSFELKE